jgi:hypothetical protein
MGPDLKQIIAYHPEIQVVDGAGERHVISLTVPEYEEDIVILKKLAVELKVGTVGGVVEKLSVGPLGVASVRKLGVVPHSVGKKVWGWFERLG